MEMELTLDLLPGLEYILPIIVDSLDIKSVCQLRSTCKRFATILVRGKPTKKYPEHLKLSGVVFKTAGFTYRNCIVKEIISDFNLMLKKLDPRDSGVKGGAEEAVAPPLSGDSDDISQWSVGWPVGQINKSSLVDYLADRPLDWLEAYCNISRGIVKQETQRSSFSNDSLVHNGSVLHYFYNPHGIVDATQRLIFLIEITLQVHEENRNLLQVHEENPNLPHWAPDINFIYVLHCVTTSWSRKYFGLPKLLNFIQKPNQNGETILHEWAKKGDANVVDAILQVMCFSRDPKLWNVHMLDLERYKHLCEEPLPLNGSGETPLEVAMKAGHFDEIVQVYEALGLPKTIKDQLWLARCADVMKNIVEKREKAEREKDEINKRSSLLSDWSSAECKRMYEDIHIANLDGENETFSEKEPKCQKRKYNPETTIISRPGSPECKKRKNDPEPADEFTSRSSSLDDSSSACIDFSEFDACIDFSEFDEFDM